MKILKIIKFISAIILIELCFGKMCYESGAGDRYVAQLLLYILYAMIIATISYAELKTEDNSIKVNIVQSIVLLLPNIVLLILYCTNEVSSNAISFIISYFIIVLIIFLLEIATMILKWLDNR